jgi:heme-degrading monooxygenase HmoA
MIQILAKVKIEELPRFLGVFATRGAQLRARHGSRGSRVFTVDDDPSTVYVLFDWESRAAFDAFRADPEVKASTGASGTVGPPEFTFLAATASFPS